MTTKKDFIATAKIIASMADRAEAKKLAESFAKIYSQQNSRFDFNKFYFACGVN